MTAAKSLTPHVAAPIQSLQGFLVWSRETQPGESKPRKVPRYVGGGRRTGQQGSPSDRARLTTFAVARAAVARPGVDGVGFALLPEWGIVALDFDNCVGPNGELPPEVSAIVERTYAEFSPSGKGVRALLRGDLGNHKSPTSAGQFGFEVFSTNGFVTLTGDMLPHVDLLGYEDKIADVDQCVVDLCRDRFGQPAAGASGEDFMAGWEPRLGLSAEQIAGMLSTLDPGMGRGDWLTVGMALHHETDGGEDGFDLWNDWSSSANNYVSEDDLRYQWERMRDDGSGRRRVTMASVIKMAKESGWRADDQKVVSAECIAAEADALIAAAAAPEEFRGKFRIESMAALAGGRKPSWLIKGVLPDAELVVLFGASGSGKSFIAIDLAMAIVRGVPWRGHRTKQGNVVMVAAEGGGSYGNRLEAYCHGQMIDGATLPIGVIRQAPNFLDAGDIAELVAAVRALGDVRLIVVDTLAQVTPGADENGSEDMGRAIAHARALAQATGAVVMLIHHAGKDASRGARGWSGLRAAADAEIEVRRAKGTPGDIRITKMKDGDDGGRWGFHLDVVTLGADDDGDAITSCVVVEADAPDDANMSEQGQQKKRSIMALIPGALQSFGPNAPHITLTALIQAVANELPVPSPGNRDRRSWSARRAVLDAAGKEGALFRIEGDGASARVVVNGE